MNSRFDLFRKQNDHFIKWVGTAERFEDLEKLMQADSANASQDNYVVVRSDIGATETHNHASVAKVVSEKELRISVPDCTTDCT